MNDLVIARTGRPAYGCILSAIALAAIAAGCSSSKQASVDEVFFEPQKYVSSSSTIKPARVTEAQKPSSWDQKADSLARRQREQEQRIGVLAGHLQRLEASRKAGKTDSSGTVSKQSDGVPRPEVKPAPGKPKKVVPQYEGDRQKAALEESGELMQYHYTEGLNQFELKQFDMAIASLKIVANSKGSKLRPDACFVLGQIYKQIGASAEARTMFEAVVKESSKADLTEAARKELKGLAAKK